MFHEYSQLYGTRDFSEDEIVGSNNWEEVAHRLAENDPDHAIEVAYNVEFYVSGK